jgi:hypothetical protein
LLLPSFPHSLYEGVTSSLLLSFGSAAMFSSHYWFMLQPAVAMPHLSPHSMRIT